MTTNADGEAGMKETVLLTPLLAPGAASDRKELKSWSADKTTNIHQELAESIAITRRRGSHIFLQIHYKLIEISVSIVNHNSCVYAMHLQILTRLVLDAGL